MSHDRGCYCGREKWDYDDCPDPRCHKKDKKVEANPVRIPSWEILREAVAVMLKAQDEHDVHMKMLVWKKGLEIEAVYRDSHLVNVVGWHSLESLNPEFLFHAIDFMARKVKELHRGCQI